MHLLSEPVVTSIIDVNRQIQADVVLQRILAPFIEELGTVREELGATRNELQHERDRREQAERERDSAVDRLAAREKDSPVSAPNVAPKGAEREPEVFPKQRWPWWMRLLAGK